MRSLLLLIFVTLAIAQQSIEELRAEARRFPNDTHVQFNLGLALVRAGRLQEAIAPLQKAKRDPSLNQEARFLLGADYFESKQYAATIGELRGLEESAHSERVLYMLEESNRRTGHIEQAEAAFHKLLTEHPDSAWLHDLMGNAYEDQRLWTKAIDEYKRALDRDPAIPNASFAIGYIYWRKQDLKDAREWLEKEAQKSCHALANYYLGEIARSERDWSKAEEFYRQATACDPSNVDAHVRLGTLLGDEKRYQLAVVQLQEAIRLKPNGSAAHYRLALLYREMGRHAQAEAEFEKVRQIKAADNKLGAMQ